MLGITILCPTSFSAEIRLAPGTWHGTQSVVVVVAADGSQTVTGSAITITGGGGIVPPVVVPPGPATTITESVKAALATVPAYTDRDQHRRAIAFGANFLSQATANTPVAAARATVRQFADAAVGADSGRWVQFWLTLNAHLDSLPLTPTTYTAALKEIAVALTSDLPPQSDAPATAYGTDSFGLNVELLKWLMEILLPLLLKLLGL